MTTYYLNYWRKLTRQRVPTIRAVKNFNPSDTPSELICALWSDFTTWSDKLNADLQEATTRVIWIIRFSFYRFYQHRMRLDMIVTHFLIIPNRIARSVLLEMFDQSLSHHDLKIRTFNCLFLWRIIKEPFEILFLKCERFCRRFKRPIQISTSNKDRFSNCNSSFWCSKCKSL